MDRRRFPNLCGATAAGSTLASLAKALSAEFFPGKAMFSEKYRSFRRRFLENFEFKGEVVEWMNGTHRHFSDQTP